MPAAMKLTRRKMGIMTAMRMMMFELMDWLAASLALLIDGPAVADGILLGVGDLIGDLTTV